MCGSFWDFCAGPSARSLLAKRHGWANWRQVPAVRWQSVAMPDRSIGLIDLTEHPTHGFMTVYGHTVLNWKDILAIIYILSEKVFSFLTTFWSFWSFQEVFVAYALPRMCWSRTSTLCQAAQLAIACLLLLSKGKCKLDLHHSVVVVHQIDVDIKRLFYLIDLHCSGLYSWIPTS